MYEAPERPVVEYMEISSDETDEIDEISGAATKAQESGAAAATPPPPPAAAATSATAHNLEELAPQLTKQSVRKLCQSKLATPHPEVLLLQRQLPNLKDHAYERTYTH